ncbi:MAG: complex I NDUFA9 subunit family protein [Parvibaculum sp.]|uniref:complex I NDUFA9 subunit family protein n=1 Tax=Parvibaculum sp. TaxID=2024848 RepID=UPI003C794206
MSVRRLTSELGPGSVITVFGGSGFIGRHVVEALARRGYRIRVAVRRPNEALFLKTAGDVGQVEPLQANIRDTGSVRAALEGAHAVVNLVGILSEAGRQGFEAIHASGAGRIAQEAKAAGIEIFVHVSAIGADAESPSAYGRSKALGEAAIRHHMPQAAILRPSVVFGPEDNFFNRFAAMARLAPALPLIGGGATRFQPVYVKDVAEAVARAVETGAADGLVCELGGPEIYTFRQLMELVLRETGRRRLLLPLPTALARIMASVLQFLPGAPLTADQVKLLGIDNVVSAGAQKEGRTLALFGIQPTAPEAILPAYLVRFRRRGQFDQLRPATQ